MSQQAQILSHLKKGKRITSLEAVPLFGCMRLAARIHDLRGKGYRIGGVSVKRNNKWVEQYYYQGDVK